MSRTRLPHRWHPSPNIEPRLPGKRVLFLILHYTGVVTAAAALAWLADRRSKVSCHYLVGEDGALVQMVDEGMRAWHAGVASWQGESDINSTSIGIEIHNRGHGLGYDDFPEVQIEAVAALARDICERHGLRPEHVLAHSDVAPARKIDPGEKFPWRRLWQQGVGHWIEPAAIVAGGELKRGDRGAEVEAVQRELAGYGYGIGVSGEYDQLTEQVVGAFQRHFRQERVDGVSDRSSVETLRRLAQALSPVAEAGR